MSSIFVAPGEVRIPMLCVACSAPTVDPATDAGRAAASLKASGSVKQGDMVFSDTVSLPLCQECADARARVVAIRQGKDYPGRWMTITAGVASALACAGWLVGVQVARESMLTSASCGLFFVLLIVAVTLSKELRRRNEWNNPPSADDGLRMALIEQAVKVYPRVSGNQIVAVELEFRNETFFYAFASVNPQVTVPAGLLIR